LLYSLLSSHRFSSVPDSLSSAAERWRCRGSAAFSSLWGAIAADMGASLLVIANGLRLLR
jgi:hypothetical protein